MTATCTRLAPIPQNDNASRDQLITDHLSLVTAIALSVQKSIPIHIELDDLRHAGIMGLFDAATKYRPDMDVEFRSYAKHRIRGAILDSLRQQDWASRDLRRRHKQVEIVSQALSEKLNREPSDAELAQEMGLTARKWQSLQVDFRSLHLAAAQSRPIQDDDNRNQAEVPCRPDCQPDRILARRELREKIGLAMKTLPARYQQVVSLYYDRELTMKEISGILGVNESRVSQIHKSALAQMQNALGNWGIQSTAVM